MPYPTRARLIPALLLAALLLPGGASAAELPQSITRVLTQHKIPSDALSVMVQAVNEDEPRLALNVDVPRNPASTAKLITTWVALDLFGPTHTWTTRLYALGPIENGVLHGDLLIKGFGDPYLVLEDFWKMLGELRRTGLREIRGRLLIDDSHFAIDETDSTAFDGQAFRLYNTLPSALVVNFQSVEFILDPDAARGRVQITTVPELPNLEITNDIKLSKGACRGNAPKIAMMQAGPATPDHLVFGGTMPFSCRHYRIARSVMTPESYAYGVFDTLWRQWGGRIEGGHARARVPAGKEPLLSWRSRHLGEILAPLNKWSNNLMTRMLLYSIAESRYPAPVTRVQGREVLRDHLASRGLDTRTLVIDNGSGLSRDSRVTARFMLSLLALAWSEPTMPEFISSLSIVGQDGTTRRRFRGAEEAGRMHLKTGSLDKVSAISGYVHTPGGRTFMVSMMLNYLGANWGIGTEIQNALLAWTYRQE
ncbi:MAG: D-alanyl-D-alanine carboxypeptidase/D-alanyl-D-alanine-endopeptidase [Gammaproteobacteria bacterium]